MARSPRRLPAAFALAAACLFVPSGCGAGLITGIAASDSGSNPEARVSELNVLTSPLPLMPEAGRTARVLVSNADLSGDRLRKVELRAAGRTAEQPVLAVAVQNGATTITVLLDTAPLRAGIDPTAADLAAQFVVTTVDGEVGPAGVDLVRQPVTRLVLPTGVGELKLSPLGGFVRMTVDGLRATDESELEVVISTRDPQSVVPGARTIRLSTDVEFVAPEGGLPTLEALIPGNDFPDEFEILVRDQIAGVSTSATNAIYEPRVEFALPGQGPTTGGSLVTLIGTALVPYDFSTAPAQLDFDSITLTFEKGQRITQLAPQDFRPAESDSDRLVFTIPPSPDGRPGRVTIRLQVDGVRPGGAPFTATFEADEEFLFANPDPFFGPRGAVLDRTPVAAAPIRLDSAPSTDAAPDFAILTEQGGVGFLQLLLAQQNGMFQPFATPRQIGNHQLGPQRNPKDLLVGDFNGDDVPDLFVVNEGGATASHLLVLGQQRPDPPLGDVVVVNAAPGSTSGRVADFDGDGHLDVLLVPGPLAPLGQRPQVLFGTGAGVPPLFEPEVVLDVRAFAYEAAEVEDFDGDGRLDVALVSGTELKLDVAYGGDERTFSSGVQTDFTIPDYTPDPASPAVGLHSCRNGAQPALAVVLAGLDAPTVTRPTVAVLPQQQVAGVWEFVPPTLQEVYVAPVEPIGQSLAADLDGGQNPGVGPVELVIGIRGEPSSVSLGLLQFDGTRFNPLLGSIIGGTALLAEAPVQISSLAFDTAFPAAGAGQPQKDAVFLVHEVDVDGVRERRLSTRLVDVPQLDEPILLPPDAGASLAFPIEGLVAGDFSDTALGAQGRVRDLALASTAIPNQQEGIRIVLNDGFGGIPRLGNSMQSPGLLPDSVTLLSSETDYDRLVFVNRDSTVGFWRPDPTGPALQAPNSLSGPLRTALGAPFDTLDLDDDTRIQVADVDGDGVRDLVVMMSFDISVPSIGDTRIALLRGKVLPASTEFPFHQPVVFAPAHGNASSFALGDFAVEPGGVPTRLELAVAVPEGSSPTSVDGNHLIFFRYQAGATVAEDRFVPSFVTANEQALLAGSGPTEVVTADFDGDGRQDLLVACRGDDTLRLFRNTSLPGGPAFEVDVAAFVEGLSSPYALDPGTPTALRLSDVNGDGNLDAVVFVQQQLQSGVLQSSVATYLSSGSGSFESARFASRTRSGDFDAVLSGALGDWNRDGVVDLLLGWEVVDPLVNLRVLFGGTR
ncbi:MAG: FG-GAP-like repeat-containing protein [Planctomycetota bacterium]